MVGRLDDWIQVLAKRDDVLFDPGYVHWAGIACMKRAYEIFRQRGYRSRLLVAAYRHRLHWTEFIGGDVILTMPHAWQRLFNESDIPVVERMDEPVDDAIVNDLLGQFPDFRRAYEPEGMTADEFDAYGATVRTLRGFAASYQDLVATMRDYMLPDPDRA
jgi:transaldolase